MTLQARLGSNMQQNQALQQAAQQPLLTRLKPQQGVHSRLDPAPQNPQRRQPHSTTAEQVSNNAGVTVGCMMHAFVVTAVASVVFCR